LTLATLTTGNRVGEKSKGIPKKFTLLEIVTHWIETISGPMVDIGIGTSEK
jgi:hypothetical protein